MPEFTRTDLLDDRSFAAGLRDYQQQCLEILLEKYGHGERRLHVVAPPGSGKTIIGIAFFQTLRLRTAILAPNAAIQSQWIDKYGKMTVDTVDRRGEVWGNDVGHLISPDPFSHAPVLSLTYQRVAVKDPNSGELHDNAEALAEHLIRNDYRLIVLDECHHLVAFWAKVLKELLRRHEMCVLGLTATPPVDRSNRELAAYLDLVGEVDFQIPMPAVIKEGNLAPFQDLVHLVHPDKRELEFIRHRHEQYHGLIEELNDPGSGLDTLSVRVDLALTNKNRTGRTYTSFGDLLKQHPSFAIALGRYAREYNLILPADVILLDEMEESPDLDDIAQLLEEYINGYLDRIVDPESEKRSARIRRAMFNLGYVWKNERFTRRASSIDRVLALSSAKLVAMKSVIVKEISNLADTVRILIITDFETAPAGGPKALKGVLDPDAGGAVGVMRAITSDPATDVVDPVMLTGSSLLCDDDLLGDFLEACEEIIIRNQWEIALETIFVGEGTPEAPDVPVEKNSTRGFYQIIGSGPDWGTRTYVLMITELFDRGITRCLIGTRGLLGEGWDSISVNVLIDLTAVASYVSVNQVQGRSLRVDPSNREKVSNNWDIVAILPEYQRGFADWERFIRKHENLFGLSDDGELERGVGHVHPALTHIERSDLSSIIETVNTEMMARSENRDTTYRSWRIGDTYSGRESLCIEIRPVGDTPAHRQHTARTTRKLEYLLGEFRRKKRKTLVGTGFGFIATSVTWLSLLANFGLAGGLEALAGLAGVVMLGVSGWWIQRTVLGKPEAKSIRTGFDNYLQVLSSVVRNTIVRLRPEERDEETVPQIRSSRRNDGSVRIHLESENADESNMFSRAMNELFQPVQDQRYILQTYVLNVKGVSMRDLDRKGSPESYYRPSAIVPVPSDFARNRERADAFFGEWIAVMGKADLLYARKGKGAKLVQDNLRKRFLSCRRYTKMLWK